MKISKIVKGIIIGVTGTILIVLISLLIIGVVTDSDTKTNTQVTNQEQVKEQPVEKKDEPVTTPKEQPVEKKDNSSKNGNSLDKTNDKPDIIEGQEGSEEKRQNALSLAIVQTSQLDGYPLVDVYSNFFTHRQWKAFHDNVTGRNVVQFKGTCSLNDKNANITIHWTVDGNEVTPAGFAVNDENKSLNDLGGMNSAASETYIQDNVAG